MEPRMDAESFGGKQIYFMATGAGASKFLVGAAFPYAVQDTNDFLGFWPQKYCSRETALQLAMEAYMRASRNAGGDPIGLAVCAAVASVMGAPRRGPHRAFIAVVSKAGCFVMKKTLKKDPGFGRRARMNDDEEVELGAEDMLRVAIGEWEASTCIEANNSSFGGSVNEVEKVEEAELQEIFFKHPYFGFGGRGVQEPAETEVFYPGAFNPLHDSHRYIMRNAGSNDACYMVNVDSPHKPTMSIFQILDTAAHIRSERSKWLQSSVLFTRGQPLFVDKFKARPERIFVVSAEVMERMLDPKWGVNPNEVLKSVYDTGVRLMVCDRVLDGVRLRAVDVLNRFVTPEWGAIAHQFCAMDIDPPEMSSSAIRAAK